MPEAKASRRGQRYHNSTEAEHKSGLIWIHTKNSGRPGMMTAAPIARIKNQTTALGLVLSPRETRECTDYTKKTEKNIIWPIKTIASLASRVSKLKEESKEIPG